MQHRVNIVIPVHNRPEHTRQTIESLFKNTPEDLFSLDVINDGSSEEMDQVVEELLDRHKFHYWKNYVAIGPGASRNYVCNQISADNRRFKYLYHSDNDVYFMSGWAGTLLAALDLAEDHKVLVLGGSCHPYLQNKYTISNFELSLPFTIGIKDAVSGYSQLMTWDTWDMFGPFDETMRGAQKKIMGSEDWAFCQKINQAGFKVGSLEPEVVIPCGKTNTYGEPATGAETFKQYTEAHVF